MRMAIALCVMLLALSPAHGQDSSTLEQIVRKRDALLTQVLEAFQRGTKEGTATSEDVRAAENNLYVFRRDSAKTVPERVRWQERILALEKEAMALIGKRIEIGLANPLDKLLAEERVTAAEQKLLELQVAK